jgi:hypothetical protein
LIRFLWHFIAKQVAVSRRVKYSLQKVLTQLFTGERIINNSRELKATVREEVIVNYV